jgi:hypothetical protein
VDVVELGAEDPFFLGVADLELQVWRYIFGLNGAEICADDASLWVCVGEVNSPDSSAGPEIEDIVEFFGIERGKV